MLQDTTIVFGFVSSIGAAVIFGVYMIPQRYAGLNPFQFLLGMGFGVLIVTLPLGLCSDPLWGGTPRQILLSYLCGFAWCTGTIGYIRGIRGMGLARATCMKNTTGVWGTLLGIGFLSEFSLSSPLPLLYALLGSLCIVYATIILTKTRASGEEVDGNIDLPGVLAALYAAIVFAAIMIPTKQLLQEGLPLTKYLFYKGQGAFLTMLLSFLIAERGNYQAWLAAKPRQHLWAIASGAIWPLGFWLVATGTTMVGLAISWPVNQLSTHFAVLFGICTKEFDLTRYTRQVVVGLVITTAGLILLGLAKI